MAKFQERQGAASLANEHRNAPIPMSQPAKDGAAQGIFTLSVLTMAFGWPGPETVTRCQGKVEMSYSQQSRNVLF
jgi:hypothetical protein